MRLYRLLTLALAAHFGLLHNGFAQQSVTAASYMATLETPAKSVPTGKPATLDLFVMDSDSMAPSLGLSISATLSMPDMQGMIIDPPKVTPAAAPGHYSLVVTFPHPGAYMLDLKIGDAKLEFSITPGSGSAPKEGMDMKANLGNWSASREGSGTSWQPDSSPMFMKMLNPLAGFEMSTMGTIQAGYVDAGGKRGGQQFFSDSMIMLMGQRAEGGGTLGLDFMTSLDPIINGQRGVPDLFQTGETAYGVPLVDRQHPHNLFSEVAASYSHPLSRDWSGFVYGGPIGEPALGDVMFMHRPSGLEIPEAPISHHWFDSTHISFGVATLGLVYRDHWKLDGSVFNGHEPGENRYIIGPEALNSASGRLTYNLSKEWSFSTSYGYLDSPEALSPGVNEHRFTASAAYSHAFQHGDNLSITSYFGQDIQENMISPSNAFLFEATLYHEREAFFTRWERVDKDELYNVPTGTYTVNKILFGDVHNFYTKDQLEYGLGAYAGVYSFPSSLNAIYGKSPLTLGVFVRIRPSAM